MKSESPIRYVGGKTRLIPDMLPYLPPQPKVYVEPFFGGGSLFFHYGWKAEDRSFISDISWPLMMTYIQLKKNLDGVLSCINNLSETPYDVIRKQYNYLKSQFENNGDWFDEDQVDLTAAFIALNHLCFNGLYRENRKGEFNVPVGRNSAGVERSLSTLDLGALSTASKKLEKTCITYGPFEPWPFQDFTDTGKGDVVFYDPPYLKEFSSYNKGGFTGDDHIELYNQALAHAKRGATVVVCGSNNQPTRDIYGEPTKVIELQRTVGASKRGKAEEALWVWNACALSGDDVKECV